MGFADLLALADSVSQDVLGDTVTYTPGVGAPVTVLGIFDQPYAMVDALTPGVTSSGPVVFLLLSDLPSDPETDLTATLTVAGVVYSLDTVQKDGVGGVRILLHEVV